jgi:preprotein translocase subunit SecA
MERLRVDDDTPIENRIISKSLEGAQKKVEGFNFDQRKNVVQYDDVMNRHRRATYSMRREILVQPNIQKRIRAIIEEEIAEIVRSPLASTDKYESVITEVFPFDEAALDRLFDSPANKFSQVLTSEVFELYDGREATFGADVMRKIERDIYLQVLDNLWMQHLENMDHMREGIHWISVGQRDPLVEYRRQGQHLFEEMQQSLRHDVVRALFSAEPVDESELEQPIETELTRAARRSVDNADKIIEAEEFSEDDFRVGDGAPASTKKKVTTTTRKKARKAERKRRAKGKRKK